jgi:glutathione S-transferase
MCGTHRGYAEYALDASLDRRDSEGMPLQLYFSPLACSRATRIALHEAGAEATFIDARGNADLRAINPLGLVPVLRTEDGEVITENAAVLQYVAERFPAAQLAPAGGLERTRLHQWLCFIGTELHKAVFAPLIDRKAPAEVKAYALERAAPRFALLERHLDGREHLLDRFSVADAYLVTVLTWTLATPIDVKQYPAVDRYGRRLRERPSVARALAEERPLYRA